MPTPLNNLFELASHHGHITRHSQQDSLKVIHCHQANSPVAFHPLESCA